MSLFSRIGRIFREEEPKSATLEEALDIIKNRKKEKEVSVLDESYNNSMRIYSEIQDLRSKLSDFNKIKLGEERAKASNDVKDKFCAASERQLSAIEKPEKDLEKIKMFIDGTEKTIASLGGLTPKQMMHVGFFFKGEISAISRKTVVISDLVQSVKNGIKDLDEYEEFFRILDKIKSSEEEIVNRENESRSIKNTIEKLENFKETGESVRRRTQWKARRC
jgi:hypothetical protein